MSRRVLAILLVVSLLFNFAVLIGFVRARKLAAIPDPAQPVVRQPAASMPAEKPVLSRMAKDLRLDQKQAGALEDLQRRQRQQASVFGDSLLVLRQDLQNELRKKEPDLDRVRALVDQESDVLRQRRLAEAELYGEFVGMLSADQRRRLGERVAGNPGPGGGPGAGPAGSGGPPPPGGGGGNTQRGHGSGQPLPPDIVRRFDRDNNGRLDPDEAKEARRDLQIRRREVAPHISQRPALGPWFDADDDGELNEAERAAMEAFMREHRPPPSQQQQQGQGDRRGAPRP